MSSRVAYILKLAKNAHDQSQNIDQAENCNYVGTTGSEVKGGPTRYPTEKLSKSSSSQNDNCTDFSSGNFASSDVNSHDVTRNAAMPSKNCFLFP